MNFLTQEKVSELIGSSEGKIFSVTFIKSDNTKRKMKCRTGVTRNVTGKGYRFNPKSKGLSTVYDFNKKEHRFIPINRVVKMKVKGNEFLA